MFGGEFRSTFDKMDREDRVHERINEGFDSWEDRCKRTGGQHALDAWLRSQENLLHCVMANFDMAEIRREVDSKRKTGDLDLVFKKYCA